MNATYLVPSMLVAGLLWAAIYRIAIWAGGQIELLIASLPVLP